MRFKEIFFIKVKTRPRPPKPAPLSMPPHMSTSLFGKISKYRPNIEAMIFIHFRNTTK